VEKSVVKKRFSTMEMIRENSTEIST